MRLIDADALRQVLEIFTEKDTLGHTPLQLCDAMPTASPWRRVEDGLPEKDEWVLTITKSYKGARIYNIATVDSDGRWWTTSQNGMREIHYIEYWMPIEPPKEDA